MNRYLITALLLAIGSTSAHAARLPSTLAPDYRGDEVIVGWKPGATAGAARLQRLGLQTKRSLRGGRVESLRLPSMLRVEDALALLRADPAVAYAEPNYLKQRKAVQPSDPYFAEQWALLNTGQPNQVDGGAPGVPGADLGLSTAWDHDGDGSADRSGDGSVIVAIVDDGVDTRHPDLVANLVPGYDFDNNDSDPNPDASWQVHGTLSAGIIGAVGDNGIGVAGVAWHVGLMPLQFDFDTASEIAAFDYARTHGARIINAGFASPFYSQAEHDAIAELGDAGILVVTAAGNEDADLDQSRLSYPANYDLPNVLAVAATNRQDQIASFSSYGATRVPVAAPGLQIASTTIGGYQIDPGVSGSSFAAAHAAGLAALTWMVHPDADYREIVGRLVEGADAGDGVAARTAAGRLDAPKALDLAPRPALLLRALRVDPDGNGALDPGETTVVRVTIENLWQAAHDVRGVLSSDSGLIVADTPLAFGDLAAGERRSADFTVTVPADLDGYRRLDFELALSDAGGYAATRHAAVPFGPLANGVPVQATIGRDAYDEFHTYAFTLDALPQGQDTLTLRVQGSNDLDLLIGYGQPAGYSIGLADSGPYVYDVPDAQVGAAPGGDEFVNIRDPRPGTYFLTVVDYDQASARGYTVQAYTSAGGYTGYRNSTDAYWDAWHDDGGGAWTLGSLFVLLGGGLWRVLLVRRRRAR